MKSKNWKKTIIRDNKTVKIAIKALELSELQVLLVVNIKNKFVGTVTDGDIRRYIENNTNLSTQIYNIARKDFVYVYSDDPENKILRAFEQLTNKRGKYKRPTIHEITDKRCKALITS